MHANSHYGSVKQTFCSFLVQNVCFFRQMKFIVPPFFLFFLGLTLSLQSNLIEKRFSFTFDIPECTWCDSQVSDEIIYIPINALAVRLAAPADPDFLSDILWLRTCYYFGSHALTDNQYDYLFYLLDLISDLSPKWEHPYMFGAIALYLEANDPFQAMAIIKKGIKNHPESWELHFFKGFILWNYFKNYEAASQVLFQASQIKGSPEYLERLSVTIAAKSYNKEFTAHFINTLMNVLNDPLHKQVMLNKIKEIKKHD